MLGQRLYNRRTDRYIEAIQYLGNNTRECKEFLAQAYPYFNYSVNERSGLFRWYKEGYHEISGIAYPSSFIVLTRGTDKSNCDSDEFEVIRIETYSDLYLNMHFWLEMGMG